MSLICSSLTWLRNHKSYKLQTSLQEARASYKDEPQWLVDQLLRRKQDDLLRRWEEREKRLQELRQKEKALEERGRKRRRIETVGSSLESEDDIDAEFLLDEWEHRDNAGPPDALSGLSKESREVLERMGLGTKKTENKEEEEVLTEEIKVCNIRLPGLVPTARSLLDTNHSGNA